MNSEDVVKDAAPEEQEEAEDPDLEDGEIEDDDEEEVVPPPPVAPEAPPERPASPTVAAHREHHEHRSEERERPPVIEKPHKKKHLTEAEKSVMRLHKLERMEREKRERYKREQMHVPEPVDDYAVSLEKALAKVLKKDQPASDADEKPLADARRANRGKKRKKKDKQKKLKRSKQDSPKNPEDDIERGSPDFMEGRSEEESSDSESSTEKNEFRKQQLKRELRRENAKNRRERRERSRDRDRQGFKKIRKRNVGICLYYLQGKCNDEHCQYSHDCVQPLKLELCKFYLLDCCAKGDKCLYMHSDFPCKYYHTGIPCPFGDDCKFAHGGPLPESVKQILFKHIETAPKEILGNFPRLSRENAHMMITQAQKNLELKQQKEKEEAMGMNVPQADSQTTNNTDSQKEQSQQSQSDSQSTQGEKKEKRNRRSRWQDPEPVQPAATIIQQQQQQQQQGLIHGFGVFNDQDMRISSNGDVDMRSLHNMAPAIHPTDIVNPNIFATKPPPILPNNLGLQGLNLLQMQNYNFDVNSALNPAINPVMNQINQQNANQSAVDIEKYKMDAAASTISTIHAQNLSQAESKERESVLPLGDVDLRVPPPSLTIASPTGGDTDIRNLNNIPNLDTPDDEDNALQIVMEEEDPKKEETIQSPTNDEPEEPPKDLQQSADNKRPENPESLYSLPKVQRDLFARIQNQQKINTPDSQGKLDEDQDQNIDWYSDDEDENKLTIEHEDDIDQEDPANLKDQGKEDNSKREKTDSPAEPPPAPPTAFGENILSNFDIAEVSKLLSTIKENSKGQDVDARDLRDPRDFRIDPRDPRGPRSKPTDPRAARDPRIARQQSVDQEKEEKPEPMTIYEQPRDNNLNSDPELGRGRSDVDLRMGMHFKSMGNYTPACEIDGSFNNHPAMTWKVYIVEIPKPDYAGLKLSASDAHTSGDPRLRKIFRLSTEEKDSPASPGSSPKASNPTPRVDPRRKKITSDLSGGLGSFGVKDGPLTYQQQLSMLQASPFYQSLTSNQKLMLNQELASRNDQSGMSDPIISAMLSNLGLQTSSNQSLQHTAQQTGQALNILNSLTGFSQPNPMLGVGVGVGGVNLNVAPPNLPTALNMGQGLLGPAPGQLGGGHLTDFNQMNQLNQLNQLAFDPRTAAQMDPRNQGLDRLDPRVSLDPRNAGPGILGNPPFGDFQSSGNSLPSTGGGRNSLSDDEDYDPMYDGYNNMYSNHQRGQNQNQQRDRNRRGRNNNNRNRNNFFRQQHNRNNRNRNSPS